MIDRLTARLTTLTVFCVLVWCVLSHLQPRVVFQVLIGIPVFLIAVLSLLIVGAAICYEIPYTKSGNEYQRDE